MSDYDRSQQFAAVDDPQLPERFQNYALDKNVIGEGPASFSYRATRIDGNREVRLKVLRKRVCELPAIAEVFQQLKLAQPQFTGDNILRFTGATVHNGILIFEYEYFDSLSLRSVMDTDAPFHPDLVALLAMEIICGLNQIHGVRPSPGLGSLVPLHRNLKPENVLVSSTGWAKLTDIGMIDVPVYCDAARLGLPYDNRVYQSPEQLLRDGYADRRTDVYALGLIMLEMATARFPFRGVDIFEVRQNIRENHREPSDSLYPATRDRNRRELMHDLGKIVERMISTDSEKRIQSLVDVEGSLIRYLDGSNYSNRNRAIADFLKARSFEVQRLRKRGFIERLFGG